MKRKILVISKPYVCAPYRRKLSLLCEQHGFTVGLIAPQAWTTQPFEAPLPTDACLWMRSLPTYFSSKNHFHLYKNLETSIREFAPDFICVEEEDYSLVTFQVFRIANKLNIPAAFFAWQNIHKHYPPPFCWTQRYVYAHAKFAMGGSDEAGSVLTRKGFKKPFYRIPQVGIDMKPFAFDGDGESAKSKFKTDIGVPSDKQVIFYGGRVVKEKGIHTTIEALSSINARNAFLLILGSGDYQDELKKQAAACLPADGYRFIDYVPTTKVHTYIKAADIMCLSSLTTPSWKEQGPVRIITESMSAKTRVIVSDSGPLPEVVEDVGLVFEEGNATHLATKIQQLLGESTADRTKREQAGLNHVAQHYSAEAVSKTYADVLRDYFNS